MLKKSKRILHAPVNIANRMTVLSNAQKEQGYISMSCNYTNNWLQFKTDISLDLEKHNKPTRLFLMIKFFIKSIMNYDIFHFYFGQSLLPRNIDLPILKLFKKKVTMHYCGSDVRLGSLASENNKWAITKKEDEAEIIRKMKRVAKFVDVAIVVDCELVEYVEPYFKEVVISHRAINLSEYQPSIPAMNVKKPLILHAPSNKGIKGTEYVLNTIEKLKEKYDFDFILVNNLTHIEALKLFSKADIIIDQLLIGAHGFFAVEAMALGKPVICNIREDLKNKYPSDLPIISANPDTIYSVVEELLEDSERRIEIGRESVRYVNKYHEANKISKELLEIYERL